MQALPKMAEKDLLAELWLAVSPMHFPSQMLPLKLLEVPQFRVHHQQV